MVALMKRGGKVSGLAYTFCTFLGLWYLQTIPLGASAMDLALLLDVSQMSCQCTVHFEPF